MTLADSIKSVQFITDSAGQRTGVLLDIRAWETLIAWIEDARDLRLAATALGELSSAGGRPGQAGWPSWDEARGEWLGEEEEESS